MYSNDRRVSIKCLLQLKMTQPPLTISSTTENSGSAITGQNPLNVVVICFFFLKTYDKNKRSGLPGTLGVDTTPDWSYT